uniref:Uncharacterized protein F1 n=1 Tax=Haloquadratum walsbyi TaxID=293091 RepID=A0A445MQL4_9EURY|nr:uncharacterized protein F1 [Haloquadratum walsbyi]
MKASFGRRTPLKGRPKTSLQDEPTFGRVVGSGVCSLADGKYLTENVSQSNTRRIAPDSAECSRLGVLAPTRATLHQLVPICRALGHVAPTRAHSRGNP